MIRSRHWLFALLLALGGLVAGGVGASERAIPAPRDVDYAGTIRLRVDASDVDRRVVRIEEILPVGAPGPLTLLYPRWLPGNNSTTGPIEMLAGLQVRTDRDERLAWQRDAEKMHAFHVDVPEGLEKPVIVLVELRADDPRLERLLYVGASRARQHLVVIAPQAVLERLA